MTNFFITGTDTNCGKTFVTAALLKYFNERQQPTQALKPIASGGDADMVLLQKHNAFPQLKINRWCYQQAIAPHFAAKYEGTTITLSQLRAFYKEWCAKKIGNLLIEGAGGLLAPINDDQSWIDFIQAESLKVIVVVGMRVGCINHALLTQEQLLLRNISCAGWVANCLDNSMEVLRENIDYLEAKMQMPLITTLSYCGNITKLSSSFTELVNADL